MTAPRDPREPSTEIAPHPYRGNRFAGLPCLDCGCSADLRMVHDVGSSASPAIRDETPDGLPTPEDIAEIPIIARMVAARSTGPGDTDAADRHESNHHGWGGPCRGCAPCPVHGDACPKALTGPGDTARDETPDGLRATANAIVRDWDFPGGHDALRAALRSTGPGDTQEGTARHE